MAIADAARRAHVAVAVTFLAHALLFASWTAHIPQLKESLGLDDAALGTALLGAPIGSLVAMAAVGKLLPVIGSHRLIPITAVGYAISGVAVGFSGSAAALFATLALWGVFHGALDVVMNTQAVTVERALGSPIMARLHGMWSVGGFVGALLGAGAVSVGIGLPLQQGALGLVAVAALAGLTGRLLPDQAKRTEAEGLDAEGIAAEHVKEEPAQRKWTFSSTVLVLGVVAFAAMFCEGAAADWSANYLRNDLGTGAGVAGLGYVAFALAMLTTRLSGPFLQSRFRTATLLPVLALLAVVGMVAALATGQTIIALCGLAALGFGLALVVPTAFSAAGATNHEAGNAGSVIAAVSALGWIGFLAGPPLIGHLADAVGLPKALAVLPLLTLVIAILIRRTRPFAPTPTTPVATSSG
ncbi:MFS transporter [Nocardia sp. NPDC052566]|uniref:MFS transporter n=1 Tax=Nocardia sp. NPDC052566 TaxID=3364330 RepID=UPI0037C5636E